MEENTSAGAILDIIQNLLEFFSGWSQSVTYLFLVFAVFASALFISYKARKRILFGAWINRYDPADTELGKSIADLLLFKLRYIKQTHELSSKKISLWNTFEDIPSFRQNLDKEIDLLASVQLGNYGKLVSGIFTFFFRIFPLFIKPAMLSGNINKYGEKKTILQASLDNYSPRKWFKYESLLWEKERRELNKENIPGVIEEIAYRIYIDLTGGDLFKSWQCFMYFTKGLRHYLNYTELKRITDLEEAEKQYLKALEIEPSNPVVKYNLGVLKYYQYEDHLNDEAISCFKQAMNCSDRNLRARASSALANALGQKFTRYKTGKPGSHETLLEALEYAKRSVALNKKLDSAYKSLAYTLHQYGETLAAEKNNAPEVITDYKNESTKYRITAIHNYKKTLKLNRKHFMAHNNLANLYLEWAIQLNGKAVKAPMLRNWKFRIKEYFTSQVIIDRNYFLKKAVYHCDEALRINPSYQFAFDNLGNAYLEKKDYNKANTAFQNAILYAPTYAEALNDHAMLYLVEGFDGKNLKRANEKHKEALAVLNDEPKRKDKLIKAYKMRMAAMGIAENQYPEND